MNGIDVCGLKMFPANKCVFKQQKSGRRLNYEPSYKRESAKEDNELSRKIDEMYRVVKTVFSQHTCAKTSDHCSSPARLSSLS